MNPHLDTRLKLLFALSLTSLCVGDTVKQSGTRKRANCWPQMPLPTARRAARGLHGKNTDYRLLHYGLMHMRIHRLRPRQRHTPSQCRSSVLALHFLITGYFKD